MHVWTLLQHTMIVVYVLRRTTPAVLLSSVLFVNKVLTLFTYDNGSEKGTGDNENEHTCDSLVNIYVYGLSLFRTPNRGPEGVRYNGI